MQKLTFNVIGLMSGTSLDGLDIAFCKFELLSNQKWDWEIVTAETKAYPQDLKLKLAKSKDLSGLELHFLDVDLGKWMGQAVTQFLNDNKLEADFIASHGHTVFHVPEKQLTLQIGNPNFIHVITNCPVISDFRTLDLAKGGQGAPLVPVGDALLFSEFDFCINLGGIANLSYETPEKQRLAYDICACNILLNSLANMKGLEYDDKGTIAKSGKVIDSLLDEWNDFPFLKKDFPKSLGIEQIEPAILSKIDDKKFAVEDMLTTAVEHTAMQISKSLISSPKEGKVLLTGGGAFNDYLVERLGAMLNQKYELVVADPKTVNYKEALIFAFLGVLNVRNEWNTLASVTGSHSNSVSGQKLGNI
ncbi:anhydro-N-acetylmuramic acid kinase [Marivirga sp.]|uniref:anhydro-N-acetylmuramic acid kinase n=1 Tax=Marivirga sp. TaxID=2018662 RepID=UPI002D7EDBA7|nr:anhydro-N-acetylmuramic acid kinase [Marivirga sp.]HET8859854.1 anhydro-N-acetylmuramic acid kinase [Marivirga sp.]